MMQWLNSHLGVETLLWFFPIACMLHDFEEIIFVEAWFRWTGLSAFLLLAYFYEKYVQFVYEKHKMEKM